MMSTLLGLALALFTTADALQDGEKPRKPNPFAPSLPLLTDEEEKKIDEIIDRFILFDTGKLTGEAAKQALNDFKKLGPEAIPALIRGMNKAAGIEASCPAVTIGKKLLSMLRASDDAQLLEFARENIGAGVAKSPHMGVIKDLRVACLARKRDVLAKQLAMKDNPPKETPGDKTLRGMSAGALAKAAASERGSKLKDVLTELEARQGEIVLNTLAAHVTYYDTEIQQLSRDLLAKHLAKQNTTVLKERLKDDRPEVRAIAAKVVGDNRIRLGAELIELLGDKEKDVQQAAHKSLVQLARGTDYGPEAGAKDAERAEAVQKWRAWWTKQTGR